LITGNTGKQGDNPVRKNDKKTTMRRPRAGKGIKNQLAEFVLKTKDTGREVGGQ